MNIDGILGDFENRYFGAGHKRTGYQMDELCPGQDSCVHTSARIQQNDGWSQKDGCQMKPHVSTVDGIILSVMLAEKYLAKQYPNVVLQELFLSAFEIKAGTKPIEDLNDIFCSLEEKKAGPGEYHFSAVIQEMKAVLRFKKMSQNIMANIPVQERPGIPYFRTHLKHLKHDITGIHFAEKGRISCHITRTSLRQFSYDGIGSRGYDRMSLLEWLIVFSQMGQLLAYDYDLIDREKSETLWMKRVKAEMDEPNLYKGPIPAGGEVVKSTRLKLKEADWRIFEMKGTALDGNVRFSGKIAHMLPETNEVASDE